MNVKQTETDRQAGRQAGRQTETLNMPIPECEHGWAPVIIQKAC